ncbi:hypothetical protein [Streptomyces sp. NPDC057257]|uniref:hypothetical protein n=1 Tax=Streptomyces sp. NPDC057257 TaxID=3346071 RepID=UPI003634F0C4
MNSAPQLHTVEISDAELDTVAGGVSPSATVTAGSTTLSSDALLAEVDSVKATALGALGGTLGVLPHEVGVHVSI